MTGMCLFLYGDHSAPIAAMLAESGFGALVRNLFRDERAPLPEAPPAALAQAIELSLLVRDGNHYAAGPRLTVIPALAERELPHLMDAALRRYAQIAAEAALELEATYRGTTAGGSFSWAEVHHSVVAGMLLDLAVGGALYRSDRFPRRPPGGTAVWAFEQISAHNGLGVHCAPAEGGQAVFAQLWHRRVQRTLRPSVGLATRLEQLAFRPDGGAGLDVKDLVYLRHQRLARKEGAAHRLQLPAFTAADAERLLVPLLRAGNRLVTEALDPALAMLAEHPWWRATGRAEDPAYRHAAVRLVLEYGIDRALDAGVLPPFPQGAEVPIAWGRWLWTEPAGLPKLFPGLAPAGEDGV